MSENDLARFAKSIRRPFGMNFAYGPAGSGKITTLLPALKRNSAPDINIMTVENPIGVVHRWRFHQEFQTGANSPFCWARYALFYGYDPEIVLMVGEIRDERKQRYCFKSSGCTGI